MTSQTFAGTCMQGSPIPAGTVTLQQGQQAAPTPISAAPASTQAARDLAPSPGSTAQPPVSAALTPNALPPASFLPAALLSPTPVPSITAAQAPPSTATAPLVTSPAAAAAEVRATAPAGSESPTSANITSPQLPDSSTAAPKATPADIATLTPMPSTNLSKGTPEPVAAATLIASSAPQTPSSAVSSRLEVLAVQPGIKQPAGATPTPAPVSEAVAGALPLNAIQLLSPAGPLNLTAESPANSLASPTGSQASSNQTAAKGAVPAAASPEQEPGQPFKATMAPEVVASPGNAMATAGPMLGQGDSTITAEPAANLASATTTPEQSPEQSAIAAIASPATATNTAEVLGSPATTTATAQPLPGPANATISAAPGASSAPATTAAELSSIPGNTANTIQPITGTPTMPEPVTSQVQPGLIIQAQPPNGTSTLMAGTAQGNSNSAAPAVAPAAQAPMGWQQAAPGAAGQPRNVPLPATPAALTATVLPAVTQPALIIAALPVQPANTPSSTDTSSPCPAAAGCTAGNSSIGGGAASLAASAVPTATAPPSAEQPTARSSMSAPKAGSTPVPGAALRTAAPAPAPVTASAGTALPAAVLLPMAMVGPLAGAAGLPTPAAATPARAPATAQPLQRAYVPAPAPAPGTHQPQGARLRPVARQVSIAPTTMSTPFTAGSRAPATPSVSPVAAAPSPSGQLARSPLGRAVPAAAPMLPLLPSAVAGQTIILQVDIGAGTSPPGAAITSIESATAPSTETPGSPSAAPELAPENTLQSSAGSSALRLINLTYSACRASLHSADGQQEQTVLCQGSQGQLLPAAACSANSTGNRSSVFIVACQFSTPGSKGHFWQQQH